jgi:transposase
MMTALSVGPFRGLQNAACKMETVTQLTDEQWPVIEDRFQTPPRNPVGGRGWIPPRSCLERILWILITGSRWKDLPKHFPSSATCWRPRLDRVRNLPESVGPFAAQTRRTRPHQMGRGHARLANCAARRWLKNQADFIVRWPLFTAPPDI